MKEYLLRNNATDVWLVGPFDSATAAADYGATMDRQKWRDPRWQCIGLRDTFGLRIEKPEDIEVKEGAYRRLEEGSE